MQLGLYIRLYGRPGTTPPPPGWESIRAQALTAEAAGLDLVVLEDGLLYPDDEGGMGLWESMSTAAAIAAATTRIGVGHAVVNSPYRHPAIVARTADTLDEISGGRYTLGIGMGNTPDDYPRFGIPADRRYSRFAEAIRIIAALLRDGRVAYEGEFYRVPEGELVLRGPRPSGPPIAIAGGKPRMLRLAAELGDEWNWWVSEPGTEAIGAIVAELDRACDEVGRDPASLRRSLDVFNVAAPGVPAPPDASALHLAGSAEEVAESLLANAPLGFAEVRVNLRAPADAPRTEAIAWLGDVAALLHAA